VDRARDVYRGESKTDARDARVIAEQARMRTDLGELKPGEQEIAELQLLLARRRDLVTDQSRIVTRLRETLLSLFPALERALDLKAAKVPSPSSLTTRLQRSLDERAISVSPPTSETAALKGAIAYSAHKALSAAKAQSASPCPQRTSPLASLQKTSWRNSRSQGEH
jgi:transposase